MKRKGLILILLSLILGVGTFIGLYFYVKAVADEIAVVAAAQDIPPYTKITKEMLKTVNMPRHYISDEAAPKIDFVVGMYTGSYGIFEDSVITRNMVKKEDEVKDRILKNQIPPGSRAIAIDVDFVKSVAGIIRPGDYVDISIVDDEFDVTPIESIKILSVKDKDGYEITESRSEMPIPDAVILEAINKDVRDAIVKISDAGQVHLSLLNPADVKETTINQDAMKQIEERKKEQSQSDEVVNTHF